MLTQEEHDQAAARVAIWLLDNAVEVTEKYATGAAWNPIALDGDAIVVEIAEPGQPQRIERLECRSIQHFKRAAARSVLQSPGQALRRPIHVRVDLDPDVGQLGYIQYLADTPAGVWARNERVSDDVIIDYDAESQVVGIELLGFRDETLAIARAFAEAHGLAFPRDLRGVMP